MLSYHLVALDNNCATFITSINTAITRIMLTFCSRLNRVNRDTTCTGEGTGLNGGEGRLLSEIILLSSYSMSTPFLSASLFDSFFFRIWSRKVFVFLIQNYDKTKATSYSSFRSPKVRLMIVFFM